MAKREKTTKARYYTVRINPETSQLDEEMLEIVDRLMAQGFSFKAIVQDAVLRADGKKPEMYSRFTTGVSLPEIQTLLEHFATAILGEARGGGFQGAGFDSAEDEESDDTGVSPFAKRFAKSFLERQKQTRGDE